jgi:hypothetical protein
VFSAAPTRNRNQMIMIITSGFAALLTATMISFIFFADTNLSMARYISGTIANLFFIIFCSAPFSIIKKAIQMRDGSYFSLPLALTNGINGALWSIYGLVIDDWLMTAPSLIGVISSVTQVCEYPLLQLAIIFTYRKTNESHADHIKLQESYELQPVIDSIVVTSSAIQFFESDNIQRSGSPAALISDSESDATAVGAGAGWIDTKQSLPYAQTWNPDTANDGALQYAAENLTAPQVEYQPLRDNTFVEQTPDFISRAIDAITPHVEYQTEEQAFGFGTATPMRYENLAEPFVEVMFGAITETPAVEEQIEQESLFGAAIPLIYEGDKNALETDGRLNVEMEIGEYVTAGDQNQVIMAFNLQNNWFDQNMVETEVVEQTTAEPQVYYASSLIIFRLIFLGLRLLQRMKLMSLTLPSPR